MKTEKGKWVGLEAQPLKEKELDEVSGGKGIPTRHSGRKKICMYFLNNEYKEDSLDEHTPNCENRPR